MFTKTTLLILPIFFLYACNECEEDQYGEHLELAIPMRTYPDQDTFQVGDTLWIEVIADKYVQVYNTNEVIRLDTFDFFLDFFISEISDTTENYNTDIDSVVLIGTMERLPLITAVVYPIQFEEDDLYYQFKAGIILKETGLFWLGLSTASFLFEYADHPALFTCEHDRRDRVDIYYHNSSTHKEVFDDLFLSTGVDYLIELVSYDEYRNVGSVTIVVED